MNARIALLEAVDVHQALLEIDLLPAQADQLCHTQPVTVGQHDQGGVPVAVPSYPCGSIDELIDFLFSEVFATAVVDVLAAQRNFPVYDVWRNSCGKLQYRIATMAH